MKKSNVDANAKALKGDDRKAFMSTCLKGYTESRSHGRMPVQGSSG